MYYDKDFIAAKLRRWEKYLRNFTLPNWDELPAFDLYMDQVIASLKKYLDFLPHDELEERVVTSSAINNYVRIKIMPAPYKKRYSRVHLAYLIIICTLKQSFSISYIQKMMPMDVTEEELKTIYNNYVKRHNETSLYFINQVRRVSVHIMDPEDKTENSVSDLVSWAAVLSGFSNLLAEKILDLRHVTMADVPPETIALPPEK